MREEEIYYSVTRQSNGCLFIIAKSDCACISHMINCIKEDFGDREFLMWRRKPWSEFWYDYEYQTDRARTSARFFVSKTKGSQKEMNSEDYESFDRLGFISL